jgi:hypothetical protein
MNDAGRQYSGSGRKTMKEVLTNLASIASGIFPAIGQLANTTPCRQKPATSAARRAGVTFSFHAGLRGRLKDKFSVCAMASKFLG